MEPGRALARRALGSSHLLVVRMTPFVTSDLGSCVYRQPRRPPSAGRPSVHMSGEQSSEMKTPVSQRGFGRRSELARSRSRTGVGRATVMPRPPPAQRRLRPEAAANRHRRGPEAGRRLSSKGGRGVRQAGSIRRARTRERTAACRKTAPSTQACRRSHRGDRQAAGRPAVREAHVRATASVTPQAWQSRGPGPRAAAATWPPVG